MIVHVMPSFLCNWNCCYCYLGDKKKDSLCLSLDTLRNKLRTINNNKNIDTINIYGGEITLLPEKYLAELLTICSIYTQNINCVTNNPSSDVLNKYLKKDFGTSLNKERDYYDKTLQTLLLSEDKVMTIIQVVTPSLLEESPQKILKRLDLFCKSVHFLRYSPSVLNPLWNISNKDYEDFMISVLEEYKCNNYDLIIANIDELEDCINGSYDPTIASNIFIMPTGNFAVVVHNDERQEYFKELSSWSDYEKEIKQESILYKNQCSSCRYYNRCYAEHITKHFKNDYCCGGYKLLDYYENIYKNNREL